MESHLFCEDWNFGEKGKGKKKITLPHDAMQEQGRSADSPSGSGGGFFLGGSYEYEKTFHAPKEWEEQEVFLEFEGVYPNAAVSLNGKELGGCRYGYSLFRVKLEELFYGENNTLCVEVDNSRLPNSRWYSGAGIYRPVYLLTGNRIHIEPDGVRVTTVSYEPAQIAVEVRHTGSEEDNLEIVTEIFFGKNKVAGGTGGTVMIDIPDARLWDADSPNLYHCKVSLKKDGKVIDTDCIQFGIRKIDWSAEGFFINGKSVLLKGGCIHHDNGILGARSFAKSELRRIKKLKENGFNAVRASHNPTCRAVLEACDSIGMYVMDETWDMWNISKNMYDYAADFMENYEKDLISITDKDYNHPSVIMYSIGNEVTEPGKPEGVALAEKIVKKLHALDKTRPVTAGINLTLLMLSLMENNPLNDGAKAAPPTEKMNSTAYNKMVSEMGNSMVMAATSEEADKAASPVLCLLDIAGYNYAISRYEKEGELHPDRLIVGTETYVYDLANTWKQVEKYPYVIGDFMWTAWDYLGEAGIGSWTYGADQMGFQKNYPWLLADTGAFDILGNENAELGMACVVWEARNTPYIGVSPVNHPGVLPNRAIWRGTNAIPCWSWQGCEGNEADVEVYSTAFEAELFINGKSAGRELLKECRAQYHVKYEPGELKAVSYNDDGSVHSESVLVSADANTRICIWPEEDSVKHGDIIYLNILLTGENGEVEGNRDTTLKVEVEGGELLAFGSANPKTAEDFLSGSYTTYYGRSQAVVKALGEQVALKVTGQGLEAAYANIPVRK